MTLQQVEQFASELSVEDQRRLLGRLAEKLQVRLPRDLHGAWTGRFPEDLEIDAILTEARTEWEKEWSDEGEFIG